MAATTKADRRLPFCFYPSDNFSRLVSLKMTSQLVIYYRILYVMLGFLTAWSEHGTRTRLFVTHHATPMTTSNGMPVLMLMALPHSGFGALPWRSSLAYSDWLTPNTWAASR
jgi:hypothetical protein